MGLSRNLLIRLLIDYVEHYLANLWLETYAYVHICDLLVFNLNQILREFLLPNLDYFATSACCVGIANLWKAQINMVNIWGGRVGRTTPLGTTIPKFQLAGRFLTLPSLTKLVCYDLFPHPFSPIEILSHNAGNQRVLIPHPLIPPLGCNVDTEWQPYSHPIHIWAFLILSISPLSNQNDPQSPHPSRIMVAAKPS